MAHARGGGASELASALARLGWDVAVAVGTPADGVEAWCRALQAAGAAEADVLHRDDLPAIGAAAARVAPRVSVLGELESVAGYDPARLRPRRAEREETVIVSTGDAALVTDAFERARPGFSRPARLVMAPTVDVPGLLAGADVVALAPILEGMACGLAVIAADPAEIVDHGETGWVVEAGEPLALANAMVHAVNCPIERRRRGDQAAEVARARHTWEAVAAALADRYAAVGAAV
jgi:glycosyltransferase involved in cell wall biosynthesis